MNLNDQISTVLGLTKNDKDWMYLLQPIEISAGQIRIARDQKRSWHAGPMQMLWVTGSLAFLCVIFFILMQDIYPTPTKLTLEKDAAELARLETQLRLDDSNAGTGRIDVQREGHSEVEAPSSSLIASRLSSVGRKGAAGSGEAKERLGLFKRGVEGRPDYVKNLQSHRAVAPTRQPYKQQGLGSFFRAMGRALGFSTHRDHFNSYRQMQ